MTGIGCVSTESKVVYRVVIAISAPQELHHHLAEQGQKFALQVISMTKRVIILACQMIIYPTAPGEVRETLAKDQFTDALIDSDIRIRIKQSRPANLKEAISLAVELEAYNRVEKRDKEFRGHLRTATSEEQPSTSSTATDHRLETLMKSVEEGMKCIRDELRELKTPRQRMTSDRWCKVKRGNSNRQDRGCYENQVTSNDIALC